jgi:hypothetical protein
MGALGEILKIHGCVTSPESLILTDEDYQAFNKRRRYLNAKVFTYFAEHPLLIVGYGKNDPNVNRFFDWLSSLMRVTGETTDDIFFIEYDREINDRECYPKDKTIPLGSNSSIGAHHVLARDFDWIFETFAETSGFNIDVGILRNILANTYNVIRSASGEAPTVNYEKAREVSQNPKELGTVLGVSVEPSRVSFKFDHHLRPTDLKNELDVNITEFKEKILKPIYRKSGLNITSFNNRYHVAFFGNDPVVRRYSDDSVEFFRDVLEGKRADPKIPEEIVPDEDVSKRGLKIS